MDATSVLLVDFYIVADMQFLSEKQFILILQLDKVERQLTSAQT